MNKLLSRLQSCGGRLQRILSDIDNDIRQRRPLEAILETLDASKPDIFESLRKRLGPAVSQALTLKILNLCMVRYHFLERSTVLLSRPFGLIVDPSNVCNLACPGCVHSEHSKEFKLFDWNKGVLSEDRLSALLKREGPYAIHTTFCNYGEPLVNPQTPKFIRLAKSYLMRTMLSTNISVPRFDAEAYVESGLDSMVLSIDGATQPVYERFRKKGSLEVVFRNIQALVKAKQRLGKRTPALVWHYLAFEHNAHEIPMALETARRMGVDQFRILTPFDVTWDDPSIRPANVKPQTVVLNSDTYEDWNLDWLDESAIGREYALRWTDKGAHVAKEVPNAVGHYGSTCHWLYKNMTMDAGGRILPCCAAPTPQADLVFSQFNGEAGEEPFNSEKHRLARLSFADPKLYRIERQASGLERDPHCVNCEWDKTNVNTDSLQIKQYFRITGGDLFTGGSLGILSSW